MTQGMNPAAPHHLPPFITAPGETDVSLVGCAIFLIVAIISLGSLYFRLHALPEHLAHGKASKLQFEVVAVLALLALFTHNSGFWVAALILAIVPIPTFTARWPAWRIRWLRWRGGPVAATKPGRGQRCQAETLALEAGRRDPGCSRQRGGAPLICGARIACRCWAAPTAGTNCGPQRPGADGERRVPVIELFLCSVFTVLPDYLYRRYVQGKRVGQEITLYSVWFELRYGITACLFLTISLVTLILYFHPSTTNAISFYRTVACFPRALGASRRFMSGSATR